MNDTPKKLGRYHIIREIGRGAMGVVYKADDPVIEREVAIKAIQLSFVVSGEEKQLYLNRFYREAKAAGKLNHPNIVTIYDVDEDKETGTPFIVMEYLEGTTLQEMLSQGLLLPLNDVNQIMIQVADALNYAHTQQVVHRDVKSANIMLLPGLKSKIMDFGIARMASSDLTKSGQFMGTPNYMSPEQIEGKSAVDGRSDLFSLGVIYYLMLTGERPFSGDSFTSISYKIVHVEPIPPRTINPAVPEPCNAILDRLLAKDPAKRYLSGAELIQDLKKMDGLAFIPGLGSPGNGSSLGVAKEITKPATIPPPLPHISAWRKLPVKVRKIYLPIGLGLVTALIIIGFIVSGDEKSVESSAKPPSQNTPAITPAEAPQQEPPPTNEAFIRSKWDLAVNYGKNGFYDKSIEQLNEILKIEPENEQARTYLETVERLKQEAATRKKSKRSRNR
ncbi:MAG TPA: protein kinase [Acidobacteriota bacterium]|nr:protein kinase [Acidobacteriota bacterium]